MRTDCNPYSIAFTPLGRRQPAAASMAGRSPPMPDRCCCVRWRPSRKLFQRMAAVVPDPRDPELIEHEQRTMLAQRVLGIACGWEDLNDHHGLRVDPLMQVATERDADEDRPLASPGDPLPAGEPHQPWERAVALGIAGGIVHRVISIGRPKS